MLLSVKVSHGPYRCAIYCASLMQCVQMVASDWLEGFLPSKEEWRFAMEETGGLYVMITGMQMKLLWPADNSGIPIKVWLIWCVNVHWNTPPPFRQYSGTRPDRGRSTKSSFWWRR
jgi:hypothetical protein